MSSPLRAEPHPEERPVRIGFLMDQIAGHITNYRNLRRVVDQDATVDPTWQEVHYYIAGGMIEKVRARVLPMVPTYFSGNARGAVELYRGLRRSPYDAILTNCSVALLFSRQLGQIPTLFDFDSTPKQLDEMEAYTQTTDPAPIAKLKWTMMRRLFQSATVLQAWTRWAKQSVIDDYGIDGGKIVVNPPGVDLQTWHPPAERPRGDRPAQVLFVGNDFDRKGGRLLLDWYATQRPDEVELHVVSRERIAPTPGIVVHNDLQPNSPELVALYGGCDLFVLPSLGECFGIATVEAMATGLPVIASDSGGTADIVDPGRNGFIVKAGDGNDLAQALETLLGDRDRRLVMGRQARAIAEERFDLERNARRTVAEVKRIARTPD
jgi:glycosyltransferase involved in cell wall biosynthesis